MKFKLVTPNASHEAAVIELMEELTDPPQILSGTGGLQSFFRNDRYQKWLDGLEFEKNRKADVNAVPSETFFLVGIESDDSEKIVGVCNIQYGLNKDLWEYRQHLSLTIRPSERRHGYAKLLLYLMICVCDKRGVKAVIASCNDEDEVIPRILRKVGGRLIGCYYDPTINRKVQKHVILVNDAARDFGVTYNPWIAEYPS